jgi:putative hydrolase of the HAD superfamily
MPLRGALFDAGDTLIQPIGGRWNPRFDFEEVVLRHAPDVPIEQFPVAFAAGARFLDATSATPLRDDYHRAMLAILGIEDPPPTLLAELDRPLETSVVEPFPEVRPVLEQLRAWGIRMAIVSDSWPSIEHLFQQLDLHDYFATFVVSAILGCTKPDPRMYRAGSDGLGLAPEECIFVDDDPALVQAAIRLGYHGLTICRPGSSSLAMAVPSIASLDEILDVVAVGHATQ